MAKIYAVAESVPEGCDYLTAGKKYEVLSESGGLFTFIDDNADHSDPRSSTWEYCLHLKGGNWTRIEEPDEKDADELLRDDAPALLAALEDVMDRLVDHHDQDESAIIARALIAKHRGVFPRPAWACGRR